MKELSRLWLVEIEASNGWIRQEVCYSRAQARKSQHHIKYEVYEYPFPKVRIRKFIPEKGKQR